MNFNPNLNLNFYANQATKLRLENTANKTKEATDEEQGTPQSDLVPTQLNKGLDMIETNHSQPEQSIYQSKEDGGDHPLFA